MIQWKDRQIQYESFIEGKRLTNSNVGFESVNPLNSALFDFQRDAVKWALRKGRACLFEDCGLGKTIQQLEWARQVNEYSGKPVLIVAPLAVSEQTKEEGHKFGISVNICARQSDVFNGINITNYEKLHKFTASVFSGVVLDESSILKSFSGKIRNQIIDMFGRTPYKLACTATPSPNDYMELGNHAEFLGVMTYSEMLSMFFVNDSGDTGQWRLKRHAHERRFWEWLCSWAIMISKPLDLGYSQEGFDLPELKYIEHRLPALRPTKGLFTFEAEGLAERRKVRKETIQIRCEKAVEIVSKDLQLSGRQWVVWCGLNNEQDYLASLFGDLCASIQGSTKEEDRILLLRRWMNNEVPILISKPTIFGFGLNLQQSSRMIFVGLSDSWEQLYQAVRRVWRFGQKNPVEVHIVIEEREGSVLKNIQRKDRQARYMIQNMIKHTKDITIQNLQSDYEEKMKWEKKTMSLPNWIY